MDIRCPSCSALYEFEEERIGPKGVNVRCTACGQVFKVRTTTPDEPKVLWMVKRQSTGEVINFDDLSTLQRWIIEQKVSRRDLISKTGDTWKSLGSITELHAFFKVVDELNEPRTIRDTDGYLTANQRASLADLPTPTKGEKHARDAAVSRGTSDTANLPAAEDSARNSAKRRQPPALTQALGPSPHELADLPEARPASESAPQPKPPTPSSARDFPTPLSGAYILADEDRTPKELGYSLGESESGDREAAISFAAPVARDGYSADYTAEYSALRKGESRWPAVLLALLLVAAGVLIILAAVRPELLGMGEETPPANVPTAASTPDNSIAAAAAAAVSRQADAERDGANADDAGTGGSGDEPGDEAAAAEEDTDTQQEADDAERASEPEDAGAAAPDTAPEPREPATPAPDRRSERDTRPPTVADTGTARIAAAADAGTPQRPEPRREEPRREEPRTPAGGYDGLMEQGNESLRSGDYQEALNQFSRAAEARPSSAEAHVGVARAYERMGRFDLAAVRFERATSVNSRYTPAWLGLGNARRRSGDRQGACAAYERVLSIVSTGGSAEEADEAAAELGCQ